MNPQILPDATPQHQDLEAIAVLQAALKHCHPSTPTLKHIFFDLNQRLELHKALCQFIVIDEADPLDWQVALQEDSHET